MLIDASVRAQARAAQQTLEAIGRRSREFAAACAVSSVELTAARALAGTSAFVSVLAFEAARVKGRIAHDPPRDDYRSSTRRRSRRVSPSALLEELQTDDPVAAGLARLGGLLVKDEGLERAMLRAFERAAGAFEAGDTFAAEARLEETATFTGATIDVLRDVGDLSGTLARPLATLESAPGRPLADVRGHTLEALLPRDVLAALYRSGIGIREIRYASIDVTPPSPGDQLAAALAEASATLDEFASAVAAWRPGDDARKVELKVAPAATIEVYEADDGYAWRLRDARGDVVATSSRAFATREAAATAVEEVRRLMRRASRA